MYNERAALRRTFARDVFLLAECGLRERLLLMQMVNELGRDADFDERSAASSNRTHGRTQ